MDKTFSFADDSMNVALPSCARADQSYIFSRSLEPAWNIVKIRRILSGAYEEKYFTAIETFSQTPPSTWVLYSQATEWFNNLTTKNPSQFLHILYRLEFLYATIIILSPSTRHPPPCNYSKLLLFNRCIDYVRQLHQMLENQTSLFMMTSLDLQRVYQISRKFINILSQSADVLVSPVPAIPQVPGDCSSPPILEFEDCLQCHERAIEHLNQVGSLLQYGARKWSLHHLLQDFLQLSTPVRAQLLTPTMSYTSSLPAYIPEGPTVLAPDDYQYTNNFNFENSSPENYT